MTARSTTDPLIVSRFDVAMEPAIEEEQILTIGATAQDGQPVALLLDPETRAKVAGWLAPESAAELVALRERVAELEKAAVAALAPHEKFPDSPHCSADGGLWPCHTVYVLEPVVAPKSDLRPGTEAARRMIQDRQDIDTGLVCIRCGEELDEENVSDFCSETCAASPAPGELAEQRHLLYDADPDSTVPPLVDIHRHKTTRRGNR